MTPLEVVKRFYKSLAPGRRQSLMVLLHPKVVIEIPEGMPGARRRRYVGIKAYIEEFLFDLFGTFEAELVPKEILEAGSRVVAIGRQKGKAISSGVPYDVSFAHIWTVRKGHITHIRMIVDTAGLRDAMEGTRSARSVGSL